MTSIQHPRGGGGNRITFSIVATTPFAQKIGGDSVVKSDDDCANLLDLTLGWLDHTSSRTCQILASSYDNQ